MMHRCYSDIVVHGVEMLNFTITLLASFQTNASKKDLYMIVQKEFLSLEILFSLFFLPHKQIR